MIPTTPSRLVAACRACLDEPDPPAAVERLLAALVSDGSLSPDVLHAGSDEDEIVLFAADDLTVFHIRLRPRTGYPPHTHGMPAVIGVYRGRERNRYFRRHGDAITEQHVSDLGTGQVCRMGADVVHAVENADDEPSAAVHVYFGNLPAERRELWDPATGRRHPFDDEHYFRFARSLSDDSPISGTAR